ACVCVARRIFRSVCICRNVVRTWIQGVRNARVRSGIVMAARAGGIIAACLLIPEKRFPQRNSSLAIPDDPGAFGQFRGHLWCSCLRCNASNTPKGAYPHANYSAFLPSCYPRHSIASDLLPLKRMAYKRVKEVARTDVPGYSMALRSNLFVNDQ